ncbi:lisH domain-containing protein FOPNL-like isoform X1 [Apis dorsata]|uniref:LisH domain-containing protein FOPNL isoform X1 n=3 Tax=Apis TaxID=7459 RepID=A0A7M7FYV4_APIME|nr:lisH domain-containing protein FOPNL isoform X1 [Apis mellifera]XP_006624264.1 lisH domain-containing protein FOPNL-like isoform X1 [Apis dorsata]XP_061937524.1 centrosomal protein 20 isoform X1 [Apis cerana]KAG6798026.1 lisH domain-containing protein FOPNL isoform X1 [Apis mellifera caucasica]KAG9436322.1 lisH domain-containing protein FOPNL isoform X1 [Apis mellifera carnica]PBC25163.1 LisH domain-containing protein C16orf63 [Apis cerana cerana]|eukprot:XP_001120606.1 lisH domain-containing protein FOPNL isoform X1 [Apis mellifera]
MATEKDLINAVRESLKADGDLGRIKAEMRTEVIKLLDNSNKGNKTKLPKPPLDIIFLNELIREYLDWMGYKYSSTVFISECDLSKQPLDRSLLLQSLGLKESENSTKLPLLCNIVETFKNLKST